MIPASTMPRFSRNKDRIRRKRLQKLAVANSLTNDDEHDMLTTSELAAIVAALGTDVPEDQQNPEISPADEDLDRFVAEAETFFA
jgi:Ca2+-binding EF-hand superfamily protein